MEDGDIVQVQQLQMLYCRSCLSPLHDACSARCGRFSV